MQHEVSLVLPDIHRPFHNRACMRSVEQLMVDLQPDNLIYLGDQMDLEEILADWKRKVTEGGAHTIVERYRQCDEMMFDHRQLCNDPKTVFMEGNHEERVRRVLDEIGNAKFKGSNIELETYFNFKKRGIKFVPYLGGYYKLGRLFLMHGRNWNMHHAKKNAITYSRNVMYGHTHDRQVYTHETPLDVNDTHVAQSIGCLCNRNPNWKKDEPNRWIHGFAVVYTRPNGTYNDVFVKITRGKFTFAGKYYDGTRR